MTVASVKDAVDAQLEGRSRTTEWVKNVTQTTTAGVWFDLTGSSGNPRAKQWFDAAPLTAQQIRQSTDGGIFHGSDVGGDGYTKYLRSVRLQCVSATPLPLNVILMDYLLYYPTIEDSVTDPQVMTNTNTLPRYTTGAGVQMMAVTISARTGGQQFTVSYTNQAGVSGRTSGVMTQNTAAAPGSIVTTSTTSVNGASPFITLQDGDTGVRSVESVTMLGADTGFFSIVLCKPLASTSLRGIDAVYEKDFLVMASEMPVIVDDAFISPIVLPQGSMSGVALRGNLISIWN